jgi:hypothetical protein
MKSSAKFNQNGYYTPYFVNMKTLRKCVSISSYSQRNVNPLDKNIVVDPVSLNPDPAFQVNPDRVLMIKIEEEKIQIRFHHTGKKYFCS